MTSDVTPDGDPRLKTLIAIRSFSKPHALPNLSDREAELLTDWAKDCDDPENQADLEQLIAALKQG